MTPHPTHLTTLTRARLVDAAEVAVYLDVERDWVYAHADELGARRLGSGPRARLRFSLDEVDACLTGCSVDRTSEAAEVASVQGSRRRQSSRAGTVVELLPIRGRGAAA